jgi:hypothetical protein
MGAQLYLLVGALVLLTTVTRIVRRQRVRQTDWELIVAFVRLEFPPEQRDAAQKVAAGLAAIVGLKIKELRPEHTLEDIAAWAESRISASELGKVIYAAFKVKCDPKMTFRSVVEKITDKQRNSELKSKNRKLGQVGH